jgi:hypothetical protein
MTQNLETPLLVWSTGLTQRSNSPVSKLVKEWQIISSRQKEVDAVNSWNLPGKKVTNLDQVLVRAGFNTARNDSQGDNYLWQLVKRASEDELAARIVLQRILPPLVAIARRRGQIVDGGSFANRMDCHSTISMASPSKQSRFKSCSRQ